MKILFYMHQFPAFGGIETVTAMLARLFVDKGHSVRIVSLVEKPGTDLLAELPLGVVWSKLPEPDLMSTANLRVLKVILSDFEPSVIVFQDSYVNIQDVLFAALNDWGVKTRLITVEHNTPMRIKVRRQRPRGVVGLFKRLVLIVLKPYFSWRRFQYESQRRMTLLDCSDKYVVLSPYYFPMIEKMVGRKRMGKVCAIPNPVKSVSSSDLSMKKQQVLFVGSLILTKGVDRLLKIWSMVERHNGDWELVIVGDGVERENLEELVSQYHLKNVRFKGFQRETRQFYRDASIFAMASDFEGWPMVLGEAMQNGCVPIVYDSFAAAHDMIDDNLSGIIVQSFDRKSYASKLLGLMGDSVRRQKMAGAAVAKADEYSLERIWRRWEPILNDGRGDD